MRTVRLAVIETRLNTGVNGLSTDPFLPTFRFDDLVASIESWLAYYERLVQRAAESGAEMVLLTEDFTHVGLVSTYLDDPRVFRAAAEHQAQLVPRRLGALAARLRLHVAACFFAAEGELVRNIAELFGPDGRSLGRYRKVHLPPSERWLVAAGRGYPVFETDVGRIGMLICYDQTWPEPFAALCLGGAELVLHPSAATIPAYRMLCRSADHHVFYASACARGSAIAAPVARILACAAGSDPELIAADLDRSLLSFGDERYYDSLYSGIADHRTRELRDRRPLTYDILTAAEPPVLSLDACPRPTSDAEEVAAIYRRHRQAHLDAVEGRVEPYHWEYWRMGRPRREDAGS